VYPGVSTAASFCEDSNWEDAVRVILFANTTCLAKDVKDGMMGQALLQQLSGIVTDTAFCFAQPIIHERESVRDLGVQILLPNSLF